jgi:hypothetical protein
MTNNQTLAVAAIRRVIDSLAASDFVLACGSHAVQELRQYEADIALDIAEVFDGRPATEAEKTALVQALQS